MNPPAKKPRRRFRQYSLRTLGLLLCLCAALLWAWSHYVAPYRAQRAAIEQLKELGATIETQPGGPAWLRWTLGAEQFTTVVKVDLAGKEELKDADLACLASLVDLRELDLSGTPVTDDGLRWVRHLKKLERLKLNRTAVTDAGLAHLVGSESLRVLELRDLDFDDQSPKAPYPVTNAGLAQLAVLKNLEELRLFPDYEPPKNGQRSFAEEYGVLPEVPAGPLSAGTVQVLQRAIGKAFAGRPGAESENRQTLERLSKLPWPRFGKFPYVHLARRLIDEVRTRAWLVHADESGYWLIRWDLQLMCDHRTSNKQPQPTALATDLHAFLDQLRSNQEPAGWLPEYSTVRPPLFLFGLALAAAESGLPDEAGQLLTELFARHPEGLPALEDEIVRVRLKRAISDVSYGLHCSTDDARKKWRRLLETCRQLRAACPGSNHDDELLSLIEPLERDLARAPDDALPMVEPPAPQHVRAAIFALRDLGSYYAKSGPHLQGFKYDGSRPGEQLVDAGREAIPALVATLYDPTPTCDETAGGLLRRQDLALQLLGVITGCRFPVDETLSRMPSERRDVLLRRIEGWWQASRGHSQATMVRNFLERFDGELDTRSRAFAWYVLGHLEGPEAIVALAESHPDADHVIEALPPEFGLDDPVRRAFGRFRAGDLRPEDIDAIVRYGDREAYLELARWAEAAVGDGQPMLEWLHRRIFAYGYGFPLVFRSGGNWAVPLLVAGLRNATALGTNSNGARFTVAEFAAKRLRELAETDFEIEPPIPAPLREAIRQALAARDAQGNRIFDIPEPGEPGAAEAARRLRQWWEDEGRELLADVLAWDHPPDRDGGDLIWTDQRIEAVAAALAGDDPAARRHALAQLGPIHSYKIEQALLVALEKVADNDVQFDIGRRLLFKRQAKHWYLPVLTRLLAEPQQPELVRLIAAAGIADALQSRQIFGGRDVALRLETVAAAHAATRAVLKNTQEPLRLRLLAFRVLARYNAPADWPLLENINRQLPFSKQKH